MGRRKCIDGITTTLIGNLFLLSILCIWIPVNFIQPYKTASNYYNIPINITGYTILNITYKDCGNVLYEQDCIINSNTIRINDKKIKVDVCKSSNVIDQCSMGLNYPCLNGYELYNLTDISCYNYMIHCTATYGRFNISYNSYRCDNNIYINQYTGKYITYQPDKPIGWTGVLITFLCISMILSIGSIIYGCVICDWY